jgi:hypothetical protein
MVKTMPIVKKLKCKLCGTDFEEREGLPGLKCCQTCDDNGRSGIASRVQIVVTKSGQHKYGKNLYTAPGEDSVVN